MVLVKSVSVTQSMIILSWFSNIATVTSRASHTKATNRYQSVMEFSDSEVYSFSNHLAQTAYLFLAVCAWSPRLEEGKFCCTTVWTRVHILLSPSFANILVLTCHFRGTTRKYEVVHPYKRKEHQLHWFVVLFGTVDGLVHSDDVMLVNGSPHKSFFSVCSQIFIISGKDTQGPRWEPEADIGAREPWEKVSEEGRGARRDQRVVWHLHSKAHKDGAQVQEAEGWGWGELYGDDLLIHVSVSSSVIVACGDESMHIFLCRVAGCCVTWLNVCVCVCVCRICCTFQSSVLLITLPLI